MILVVNIFCGIVGGIIAGLLVELIRRQLK